jgi:6-pyruvoyltetrahydropterin/6-carboxytetrahydropterin synthase
MQTMDIKITRKFTFDAAHQLTKYHGKCERMHGHTYMLEVTVEGPVQENGMVVDFVLLKQVVQKKILEKLDHHNLNDQFENPTAEHIAQWIFEQLKELPEIAEKEMRTKEYRAKCAEYVDGDLLEPNPAELKNLKLIEIRLCETQDTCVTVRA